MQTTVQLSNEDIKNLIANAFRVDTEKVSMQVHTMEDDMLITQATVIIDNPIMSVPFQPGVRSQTDDSIPFRVTNKESVLCL